MNAVLEWIKDRTGLGLAVEHCRQATVPGRACLGHAWPTVLGFTFAVQVITGLFLWMFYSPSAGSAWESVYYLQYEVQGGWLLRGIHHYTGQAMLVLVGLYLIQMLLRGTYRAPREFVFWTVTLMGLVLLGLLLTGDLLAWDENSQASTSVRTEFCNLLPVVGGALYRLAVGGPSFGHLTLTRFFALHAGLLAIVFLVLLLLHGRFARRARFGKLGNHLPQQKLNTKTPYWPNQAMVDAVACLVVMVVVVVLAVVRGVELGAPADPTGSYSAARPEWAFLGLYGFAHLFPGEWKILPIFVIPTALVGLFFLMPLIGRIRVGHALNILLAAVLLVGNVALSYMVLANDKGDEGFQAALQVGREDACRVRHLIDRSHGIPAGGALSLLQNDPKTQGPRLYKQHCAACHDYTGADGRGIEAETPSAPNLFGYASRAWVAGWLDPEKIITPHYFGGTHFRGSDDMTDMVDFVRDTFVELDDDDREEVESIVIALSAEAQLPCQCEMDRGDAERIEQGRELIVDDFSCTDCHRFRGKGSSGNGPDLTGYGSREWTIGVISNPAHKRFYGKKNDRMPAYAEFPSEPGQNQNQNILSDRDIRLLADWLRGQWVQ
jgi:ubiquinol-cytochrome c reductase cytochrome b subunit